MEKQFKTIDISHLKSFAKGGTGECYRIDQDTILKLYYEGFPTERILNEKEGARAALVAGVPTAISYWLVQAGERQGVRFQGNHGFAGSRKAAAWPDYVRNYLPALQKVSPVVGGSDVSAERIWSGHQGQP